MRPFDGLSIMLAILVLNSGQSWADAWQQTGSARVSTEYESNPAMSPSNPEDVKRVLFEPSYSLTRIIGENELMTGIALQIARSSNQSLSPNRDNPRIFLNWKRQYENGELGVASRYAEIATRDAGVDLTGTAPLASTRASRTLSGRWSNALSEHSTLSADSNYERVSYTNGNYIDYATRSGSIMLNYAWNEYKTSFLQILHTDYDPAKDNTPSSFTNFIVAGLNWRSSDTLDGILTVGKAKVSDGVINSQGTVTVRYTGERNHLSLSLIRQIAPNSLGGFVTTDQANGSWSYSLSEKTDTGIDLMWQQSHFTAADITNSTTGAWVQHDLNPFWGLRTYYQERRILYGVSAGGASSYILGFTLVYTRTGF